MVLLSAVFQPVPIIQALYVKCVGVVGLHGEELDLVSQFARLVAGVVKCGHGRWGLWDLNAKIDAKEWGGKYSLHCEAVADLALQRRRDCVQHWLTGGKGRGVSRSPLGVPWLNRPAMRDL